MADCCQTLYAAWEIDNMCGSRGGDRWSGPKMVHKNMIGILEEDTLSKGIMEKVLLNSKTAGKDSKMTIRADHKKIE